MKKQNQPVFHTSLLHPKYWGVWFGFGLLALFVNILPYRLLFFIGQTLGQIGMKFGKERATVTKRNLELAFPEKSQQEIDTIAEENLKNTGLALIETGIAWFWPNWRFKRLLNVGDTTEVRQFDAEKKGVMVCCTHSLNLEITARAFASIGLQGYGIYRPHTNPAYEFIQIWGRTHCGNGLIDRKDLKGMIRVLRQGHRFWYLPDQDYGRNQSVFVPFFAVQNACTTTGPSILASTSKCAIVLGSGFRNQDGKYDIIIEKSIHEEYPKKDPKAAAAFMNKEIEKVILKAPEQWMWLHKRFKTMEDRSLGKGSLYK